jgi:hypothetical protein
VNPEPTPADRARILRAQRRSRISAIRKRVAVVSLGGFIALFSTIYIQMAAGHDPALAHKSTNAHVAKSASSSTSSSSAASTDTGSSSADTGIGTGSSSQSTAPPAAVTTSQS